MCMDFLCILSYNISKKKGGVSMALNPELKNLINDLANVIREIYSITGPITDIDNIVKKMGGTIVEDSSLDSFSDGKIKKTGISSFEIAISPLQGEERRNFTIAHELGHLFLHMGFKTNKELWDSQNNITYYRNGNSDLEYQSNEFAAAFLMPQRDYKQIMDQNTVGNIVDTSAVAKFFHVSIDAAANRGKWLGYLRW